jgi:hypothetical protein
MGYKAHRFWWVLTGESGAVLEGGHRAGASADLAEAALDRVVVRTALRASGVG